MKKAKAIIEPNGMIRFPIIMAKDQETGEILSYMKPELTGVQPAPGRGITEDNEVFIIEPTESPEGGC